LKGTIGENGHDDGGDGVQAWQVRRSLTLRKYTERKETVGSPWKKIECKMTLGGQQYYGQVVWLNAEVGSSGAAGRANGVRCQMFRRRKYIWAN
jgi:hypothetical protein